MSRETSPGENWVKYEMTMKGGSGKLKTTLIGDYLLHQDLLELDEERVTYEKQLEVLREERKKIVESVKPSKSDKGSGFFSRGGKEPAKTTESAIEDNKELTKVDNKLKRLREEYVPIDFQAYSVDDALSNVLKKRHDEAPIATDSLANEIKKDEKLWRISSLTASVDDETRILILPQPESKRKVKVSDTRYEAKTYQDLLSTIQSVEKQLTDNSQSESDNKRYEDKTEEEIQEDMARKRKQQFGKIVRYRYYQIAALLGGVFFYMFAYRQFLAASPVVNSVSYNQAVAFIKANRLVKSQIGAKFQIMNCNGKIYPYKKDVKFDIILFGTNANGKVKVTSFFDRAANTWHIKEASLYTRGNKTPLIQ